MQKRNKTVPPFLLVWLGSLFVLTISIGMVGWKMHTLCERMVAPVEQPAHVQVVAGVQYELLEEEKRIDVVAHPSPKRERNIKSLPEMQEWDAQNVQMISESENDINALKSLLGENQREASYTSQIAYLASLRKNARFHANSGGRTGLSIEAMLVADPRPSAQMGFCRVYLATSASTPGNAIELSVVNYGSGFVLERLDGDHAIPTAELNGFHFGGWWHNGKELSADYVQAEATYLAKFIDDIAPSVNYSAALMGDGNTSITVNAQDGGNGIAGVYVGKVNPSEVGVDGIPWRTDFTGTPAGQRNQVTMQQTISEEGTYYVAAKDMDSNMVVQEIHAFLVTAKLDNKTQGLNRFVLTDISAIKLPKPSKPGYSFVAWEEEGKAGSSFVSIRPTANTTILPIFQANAYNLYFDASPGTVNPGSQKVYYEKKLGTLPTPKWPGYVFEGWYTGSNGTGTRYTENTKMSVIGNVALYAKWRPANYTIIFEPNGATSGGMNPINASYNQSYVLPRNNYARPGYVFKGWSLSPNTVSTQNSLYARDRAYNGAEWLNEDVVGNLTQVDGAQVRLYAIWQAIEPGVMDYRYCLGSYQYFACVTTNYVTENSGNEGALFVAMTPSGNGGMAFGPSADWSTSYVRANLNDANQVDFTGLKACNTTVNQSYSGIYYNYSPYEDAPCNREDCGLGGRLTASFMDNRNATYDYLFIPDVRDFYNYFAGNSWNWFWDMNLDGTPDTLQVDGMVEDGYTDTYYDFVDRASNLWASMGWYSRCWFRNSYTGYGNYPFYMASYGVGVCNPVNDNYASYRDYCEVPLLLRSMYTMPMN